MSDKPISLMIHRVGKSLLIDEFDIHKYLLRKQKDDWQWLRKFVQTVVSALTALLDLKYMCYGYNENLSIRVDSKFCLVNCRLQNLKSLPDRSKD